MIHSEIRKFWEDKYGTVHYDGVDYFQFVGRTGYTRAAIENGEMTYYFHGSHNEKEMLRLIRLKSFL